MLQILFVVLLCAIYREFHKTFSSDFISSMNYCRASTLKNGITFNRLAKHATMSGKNGLFISQNQDINCP
ncbi:hypothetical protein [Enterobacter hormaechei]|uniref:hypothetical protein n=1 Tax=Enterobacter hormaechei TaxID=158836 RepID=UPI000BB6B851|nr:hypothetical protein [Enterobacter hormaechei]